MFFFLISPWTVKIILFPFKNPARKIPTTKKMLRRQRTLLFTQFFKKMADMDPHAMRVKDAPTGKPTTMHHDPIFDKFRLQSDSRARRVVEYSDNIMFHHKDDVVKWMEVKQAAKVLAIELDELHHLTSRTVELRFMKAYQKKSVAGGVRDDLTCAAELLFEYVDSNLQLIRNREYYRKTIENLRIEVEKEQIMRREENKFHIFKFLAVMVVVGNVMIVMMVYVARLTDHFNNKETIDNTKRFLCNLTQQNGNAEPEPNYITRYANTPSALEADERDGIDPYSTDEVAGLAHLDVIDATRLIYSEDEEMIKMYNEEHEIQRLEQNNQLRERSVWVIRHEDGKASEIRPSSGSKDGFVPSISALMDVALKQYQSSVRKWLSDRSAATRRQEDVLRYCAEQQDGEDEGRH